MRLVPGQDISTKAQQSKHFTYLFRNKTENSVQPSKIIIVKIRKHTIKLYILWMGDPFSLRHCSPSTTFYITITFQSLLSSIRKRKKSTQVKFKVNSKSIELIVDPIQVVQPNEAKKISESSGRPRKNRGAHDTHDTHREKRKYSAQLDIIQFTVKRDTIK